MKCHIVVVTLVDTTKRHHIPSDPLIASPLLPSMQNATGYFVKAP